MLVMSTSSHKEGRFLFLLMPLYLLICIRGYRNASRTAIIFSVLINLFFFIEANVYGKEGAFQVLNYIRHENPKNVTGVMFLT
jgi:O-antigen ligase